MGQSVGGGGTLWELGRFHALMRVGITQVCKHLEAINEGLVHFIIGIIHFPPLN